MENRPTIRAAVSPKILAKADRLFSNTLSDIFIELLQNARRAGATEVDIQLTEVASGTEIIFTDNGIGIQDFSVLLHLGDSDWSAETVGKEDPAGMGFFSLIHSGVIVRSHGKEVEISKEGFLGQEVAITTAVTPERGTELVFLRAEVPSAIADTAARAALYGSLLVRVNGAPVPQKDFLQDALYVKEVSGVRIGIYRSSLHNFWNFHGRVLGREHSLPSLSNVLLDGDGHRFGLSVRIDVVEARDVHLKLPDRTAIVEDEGHRAICEEATKALYEYLATLPEHIASYKQVVEARALGIHLREASPWFDTFFEQPAWDCDNTDFFAEKVPVLVSPATHAIVDRSDATADVAGFTFQTALEHLDLQIPLRVVDDTPGYEGFSWYAAIPRIHSFRLSVDGILIESGEEFSSTLEVCDAIQLSFVIEQNGEQMPVLWELPFAAFKSEGYADEFSIAVTRTSKWVAEPNAAGPFDLVDAATYLAFSPNDSFDSDSSETQLQEFRDRIRSTVIGSLGGKLAELRHVLYEAITDDRHYVVGLLREASVSEVRLLRTDEGRWEMEFLPLPSAA